MKAVCVDCGWRFAIEPGQALECPQCLGAATLDDAPSTAAEASADPTATKPVKTRHSSPLLKGFAAGAGTAIVVGVIAAFVWPGAAAIEPKVRNGAEDLLDSPGAKRPGKSF